MLTDSEHSKIAIELRDRHALETGLKKLSYKSVKGMTPFLVKGDRVLVKKVVPDHLRIGDLILIQKNNRPTVRRFLYKTFRVDDQLMLVAKADQYRYPDLPFPLDCLTGLVIKIEKTGKKFDLQKPFWKTVFRITGVLSLFEERIWTSLQFVKIKVYNTCHVRDSER